jgi:very-short-patch-repair endonuclease
MQHLTSACHPQGFLEAALPHHRIMAQVAMGALLRADEVDRRRAHSTRNRFSQKIVDFVIVTRDTAEVVALVELDDRRHSTAKDAKRDAMTAAAGYRTIRIPSRSQPSAESVRKAVDERRPPTAPRLVATNTGKDLVGLRLEASG